MNNEKSKNKRVAVEVEKTMNLLEDPQLIAADPFFYTRLKARMDSSDKAVRKSNSVISFLRPAFLLLFAVMNIFTIYYIFKQDSVVTAQKSFADEYNLALNNTELLDINIQQGGEQNGIVK